MAGTGAPVQTGHRLGTGFNDTNWPLDFVLDWARSHPGGAYVTFSYGPARDLIEADPTATVIVRLWPDDDHAATAESGRDFVYRAAWEMHQQIGQVRDDIYTQYGNEPHPSHYAVTATKTLDAMQTAREKGIRLCVGNWGQGHPVGVSEFVVLNTPWQERVIIQLAGLFEDVYRALADGWHLEGWHCYHAADWGSMADYAEALAARHRFADLACDRMGIERHRKVINEWNLSDSCTATWAKGHKNAAAHLGWTGQDMIKQMQWFAEHASDGWPVAWFGLQKDAGGSWWDFSLWGQDALLRGWSNLSLPVPPTPEPPGCWPQILSKLRINT